MAMLDDVTINQLRAFVAVCDQGSFSGAARKLNRAQSAISHAIKALERAFDVQLFERNIRKATLTAAGRSLLPDVLGHMPRHMVAEDLANGSLVELRRRAWHMRPLTFMISQRRGYALSECETRLVDCLGNPRRLPKETSQRSVSRKGEKPERPAMRKQQSGRPATPRRVYTK